VLKAPAHPYTRALLAACPTPDLDRPLNFEALKASGLSNPLSWPAPFGFAQAADLGLMAELTPNHLVRLGTLRESSPQRKTA
jgi:peptide/nickel transport system ATP-binding protein